MLEHRAQMKIAGSHPCLAGHFPGNPVVPAVVLLDCVAEALRTALGRAAVLSGIPAAKFLGPIAPEQEFTVELRIEPEHGRARFRCVADGHERVQGRLEYRHVA